MEDLEYPFDLLEHVDITEIEDHHLYPELLEADHKLKLRERGNMYEAQPPTKKRKRQDDGNSNQVYHFGFRWSVPHNAETLKTLKDQCKGVFDKYIFQAEYTENEGKGNPHYQGYGHRKEKIRAKTLAVQLNDDLKGIEIRPASNNGKNALQAYCMKDDTRVAGPWADRKLYLGADLWAEEKQLPWQRSLNTMFAQPPGNRKMIWVYDPVGNNGKTKYIKWLCYKKDALPLGYGHSNDVLNLVSKFQNKNIYAFNLTRSKPANLSELDLYSSMESIKDGMFINMKYETQAVLMNPPHVLVCANTLPKYNQISVDRWEVYEIIEHRLISRNL